MTVLKQAAEWAQLRSYQSCCVAVSRAREKLGSIRRDRSVSTAARAREDHAMAPVSTQAASRPSNGSDRGRVTGCALTVDGPTGGEGHSPGVSARNARG